MCRSSNQGEFFERIKQSRPILCIKNVWIQVTKLKYYHKAYQGFICGGKPHMFPFKRLCSPSPPPPSPPDSWSQVYSEEKKYEVKILKLSEVQYTAAHLPLPTYCTSCATMWLHILFIILFPTPSQTSPNPPPSQKKIKTLPTSDHHLIATYNISSIKSNADDVHQDGGWVQTWLGY